MMLLNTYVRRSQRLLRRFLRLPLLRQLVQAFGVLALGFALSAGSLANKMQPFALGLLCAGLPGWLPVWYVAGGALGYWLLWGHTGLQALTWLAAGLPVCLLLYKKRQAMPLLPPAMAALIVSVCGVAFQLWLADETSILLYLLRVALAFGSCWLFMQVKGRPEAPADWVALGILSLCLGQIAPVPFLDLGILAAAALLQPVPFPAVALMGLGLDLARITPVPMTAVLCLGCLLRMLPIKSRLLHCLAPAFVYVPVMVLCGKPDLMPLPALVLGCLAGLILPKRIPMARRRGETGFAQVRLEMSAGMLAQSGQLLDQEDALPIDEVALVEKAVARACSSCPCRKNCRQAEQAKTLPTTLLHQNLAGADELPMDCKKRGRLLLELRRAQDQLRLMKADREHQQEYRQALQQQYQFLAEYLQSLADQLPQRGKSENPRFGPEVAVSSAGKERTNGDRCVWFAGPACQYYLLLCDGMGTGDGAAQEAKFACEMLRKLLVAGFPAEHALRSLNSLCTLRGRAGAVTVDLAQIHLQTGKVSLYKWGAAPSYLLSATGPERIGNFGIPLGFSVAQQQETVEQLSLRRGETLVLLSDGIQAGAVFADMEEYSYEAPGVLAARLLEKGNADGTDDATVAVVRLTQLLS